MKNIALVNLVLLGLVGWMFQNPSSLQSTISVDAQSEEMSYQMFLDHFDTKTLPYEIGVDFLKPQFLENRKEDKLLQPLAKNILPRDAKKFIPEIGYGQYSRMGPDDFKAEALLVSKDSPFDFIVYSQNSPFDRKPHSFTLVVFNKKGELIDQKTLASCHGMGDGYLGKIDESFNVYITEHKARWKKDVGENSIMDNEIVGYDTVSAEMFTIKPNGTVAKKENNLKKAPQPIQQSIKDNVRAHLSISTSSKDDL